MAIATIIHIITITEIHIDTIIILIIGTTMQIIGIHTIGVI